MNITSIYPKDQIEENINIKKVIPLKADRK